MNKTELELYAKSMMDRGGSFRGGERSKTV